MTDLQSRPIRIRADDGHEIHGSRWTRTQQPIATLQIFHGLGEYHQRYERFASLATQHDLEVIAHDHRGHGPHSEHLGFFAAENGWDKLCQDARLVHEQCIAEPSGRPVLLLGHSMGSYLAQSYAMRYSDDLCALLLSASTWPEKAKTIPGHWLAKLERLRLGARGESALLHKLGFGDFNKPFAPARTELDWLSRDSDEVDRYIADPLCGGPYSAGLWIDVTGALNDIGSRNALQLIRGDLPMLLCGGSDDPVGGARGISKLAESYRQTGHDRVSVNLYEGGRHEMFNEINRDEFSRDVLAWCEQQLPGVDSAQA